MVVELIIIKEEVLHDITSDITQLERMRNLETPILTSEETDTYNLNRQIDLAVSMAIARMQAYVCMPSQGAQRIAHNHTDDWKEKNVFLDMPHDWPVFNMAELKNVVHRFIVKTALHNYLRCVLPEDPYTALSLEESERAYNEINANINSRIGGVHIYPTPFG